MTVTRDDGHPPWPIRSGTYREDVQRAKVRTADITALILAEMIDAARMDHIRFDDEQRAFIAQALSDAVQETMNRVSAALDQTAPPSP